MLPAFRTSEFERKSHATPHPRRSADPSRGARKDRELPDRCREGSPGGRGGERHRRRGHAAESASEKGEKGAGCRRSRVPVSRVRQLSRRMAPAPRAQDVDRLAHFPDGVRQGRAGRRSGRSRAVDRERKAGPREVAHASRRAARIASGANSLGSVTTMTTAEMELLKRITSNPKIFGGKPIVRGLRISVESILSLLAQGETVEAILED